MRHDYSTEQFQAFRGEVRESFWGQVRWRTQHVLQQILEADSEQQMAEYLGLARTALFLHKQLNVTLSHYP